MVGLGLLECRMIEGRIMLELTPQLITEFITTIDMWTIITESSTANVSKVDDGPRSFYGNLKSYKNMTNRHANKMGFQVISYVLKDDQKFAVIDKAYPDGPIGSVSFAPSGVSGHDERAEHVDVQGTPAWTKYKAHIMRLINMVGWKVLHWLDAKEVVDDTKIIDRSDPKPTSANRKDVQYGDLKTVKEWKESIDIVNDLREVVCD